MTTATDAQVVVGVDGSAASLNAVGLAVRMAVERRRQLQVAQAFVWPPPHVPVGPSPYGPPEDGLRNDTERIVRGRRPCSYA